MGQPMVTAEHIGTDQIWQEERTVFWFALDGVHYGTGLEFSGDVYGVSVECGDTAILDEDGAPLTDGDWQTLAVRTAVSEWVGRETGIRL